MKVKAGSVVKQTRRGGSVAKKRAPAKGNAARRFAVGSDEPNNAEGGDKREHHNQLEKGRRDALNGHFDALTKVCPTLKGLNSGECNRGKILIKSAAFIKKWSKHYDPSDGGMEAFQNKVMFMNEYCKEMENIASTGIITDAFLKMEKHFKEYKSEYAMFTRNSFAAKLCKALEGDTNNNNHSDPEDESEEMDDDEDIDDVGEDDLEDDEDTDESDEESNEEDDEDECSDATEEDETEANREDEDQDISEETGDEGEEFAEVEIQENSIDQQEYQENNDDYEDEEIDVG